MEQQKAAVNSGYWPLFRYNPDLVAQGKNPFQLDSRAPSIPLKDYVYNETRYTMLVKSNPEHAKKLLELAQEDVAGHWKLYDYLAHEPASARRAGGEEMIDLSKTIDLSTTYLGLKLKNPLVASSSPMCQDVGNMRRMEDAGAAAVVLQSLFEEQIEHRERRARPVHRRQARRFRRRSRSLTFPELTRRVMGPEAYLAHIAKCKQAVKIPDHRQPERHHQGRLGAATPSRCSRPARMRWS